MKKISFFSQVAVAVFVAAAALEVACGGDVTSDTTSANDDAGSDARQQADGSSPADAGMPKDSGNDAVCPDHWQVYGDTNPADNLGHVDPRAIASGECHAVQESLGDGGFAPTDFTLTMAQSAPSSGMFVTHVVQTTPFPIDRVVCFQSSGPNTGAAGYPDDGGLMCLTDVPEDHVPWDPNVVMFTNLEDSDAGVFVDLNQSMPDASAAVTNGSCRFTKN